MLAKLIPYILSRTLFSVACAVLQQNKSWQSAIRVWCCSSSSYQICYDRYFPCNKTSWHDNKGIMVLEGTYEEAVKMMGDIAFLSALTNFPKECINDETVELLQPYFNASDFNFESAKKVGLATCLLALEKNSWKLSAYSNIELGLIKSTVLLLACTVCQTHQKTNSAVVRHQVLQEMNALKGLLGFSQLAFHKSQNYYKHSLWPNQLDVDELSKSSPGFLSSNRTGRRRSGKSPSVSPASILCTEIGRRDICGLYRLNDLIAFFRAQVKAMRIGQSY